MRKIPQLFLLSTLIVGMISPVTVLGDEVATDPSATDPSATDQNQVDAGTATGEDVLSQNEVVEDYSGTGTTYDDAYVVNSVYGLTSVIKKINDIGTTAITDPNITRTKIFVRLNTDIIITDKIPAPNSSGVLTQTDSGTALTIKNQSHEIIIDGTYNNVKHSVLYNSNILESISTSGLFKVSTDYTHVTFQNIKFGSKTYPNSDDYGFCTVNATNCILTVNNLEYYAEKGGQPFYATNSSTINFSGINSFEVNGPGDHNEEFAEFRGTINFKLNSNTKIVHKTPNNKARALLWAYADSTINLETSASVDIESAKTQMVYGSTVTWKFGENSNFNYTYNDKYINGEDVVGSHKGNNLSSSNTTPMSLSKNASVQFLTDSLEFGNGEGVSKPDIISRGPSSISFTNTDDTKNAMGTTSANFQVTNNASNVLGALNTTDKNTNSATTATDIVQEGFGKSITGSTLTNYSSVVYDTALSVGGVTSSEESGANISQITSSLTDLISSSNVENNYNLYSQYYITKDGSNPSENSGTSITNGTDSSVTANGDHKSGQIGLTLNSSNLANNSGTIKDLLPGTYKIFGRAVLVPKKDGTTYYSNWIEPTTSPTIPAVQYLIFPKSINLNDNFKYSRLNPTDPLNLDFTDSQTYTISSSSNQVLSVTPTNIDKKDNNEVELVSGNPGTNNDHKLQLEFVSTQQTNNIPIFTWDLGKLPREEPSATLQPYWVNDNTNQTQFKLNGAYSGPIINDIQNVAYDVTFSISPTP